MGRAARARKGTTKPSTPTAPVTPSTSIRIEPTDYWELRTRIRDVEAIQFDLMKQRQNGLEQLAAAEQRCQAAFARLTEKYHLPDLPFKWNDDTLELLPQSLPVPAAAETKGPMRT